MSALREARAPHDDRYRTANLGLPRLQKNAASAKAENPRSGLSATCKLPDRSPLRDVRMAKFEAALRHARLSSCRNFRAASAWSEKSEFTDRAHCRPRRLRSIKGHQALWMLKDGPNRTLTGPRRRRGAARQRRHSPQLQNSWIGEFTICGRTGLVQLRLLTTQHLLAHAERLLLRRGVSCQPGRSQASISPERSTHFAATTLYKRDGGQSRLAHLQQNAVNCCSDFVGSVQRHGKPQNRLYRISWCNSTTYRFFGHSL